MGRKRSRAYSSSSDSSISIRTSLSSDSDSRSYQSSERDRSRRGRYRRSTSRPVARGRSGAGSDRGRIRDRELERQPSAGRRGGRVKSTDRKDDRRPGPPKGNGAESKPRRLNQKDLRKQDPTARGAEPPKLSPQEELERYMKAARQRVVEWSAADPGLNSERPVVAEFQRLLSERFSRSVVSARSISIMTSLMDELLSDLQSAKEVLKVLEDRLRDSHAAWIVAVSSGETEPGAPARGKRLLQDWYIVDGLFKHFKQKVYVEEKKLKAKGQDPTTASTTTKQISDLFTNSAAGLLKNYLPWSASSVAQAGSSGLASVSKKAFNEMFKTWKRVVDSDTFALAMQLTS